jgi:hypothetical protein
LEAVALHETVAVPDPATLPGLIEPQTRPEGTVSVKVTVPENLLIAVTVIVDVPEAPALAVTELAAIVKSRN